MKKILICEDHSIVVEGLRMLLQGNENYTIVAVTQHGEEVYNLIQEHQPDILLLDLNLPGIDGFKILEQVRKINQQIKVLILTMYHDAFLIDRAKELKVNAYLLKNVDNSELLQSLELVYEQEFYISSGVNTIQHNPELSRDSFSDKVKLTNREWEIIKLIVEGKSNQEIADILFVSPHTIMTHKKNIFKKLKINSTTELVRLVYEQKI